MMLNLLKPSISILLIITILIFPNFSLANVKSDITLCTGQAFGSLWSSKMQSLIENVFAGSGLKPRYIKSPTKRATRMFIQKKCDGFFVSTKQFDARTNRKDTFYVPESVLSVKLEVYVNNDFTCQQGLNCLAKLGKHNSIGVFRSDGLVTVTKQLTNSRLIEFSKVNQGLEMLRKHRVEAFVFPSVNEQYHQFAKAGVKRLGTFKELPLYIWLDKDFEYYKQKLSTNIKSLKTQKQWKNLLTPID